jgi:VID27 N-terminal region/VID27 C-terminal WD40-like domain/VID27 PH-like domain
MFMLRNGQSLPDHQLYHLVKLTPAVTKYLFGDPSKETLIELPQGQLYIVRPRSPKGYSELIFKDAAATIRRTVQEFQYQLVIQRVYEEGEAELLDEEEDDDGIPSSLRADKDEKAFLLDKGLHFRAEERPGGEKVLAWQDDSGDDGDLFEFICDASVKDADFATFQMVAVKCQYERKYRKPNEQATEKELEQFNFASEQIPDASPLPSPISRSIPELPPVKGKQGGKGKTTQAPAVAKHPEAKEILTRANAELHLFDFDTGAFIQQDPNVIATVSEVGNWHYWLQIGNDERDWLGQPVVADLNPVFNFEYLSFIFNHYTDDGSAYSWLLRFKDQKVLEGFQEGLMQALWEQLNETKWVKAKKDDRDYVLEAFEDLTMEDPEEQPEVEVEEPDDDAPRSEHYDSDESADDFETQPKDDGNVNSQLAVGYKHDRSFVVRGSKIGVFKHTPNNNLEFSTNISKVETPKGKLFSPKKVMLHAEDQDMILQNSDNPNSLYRMDLEYGKIVDEWKVHDDIPVVSFAPENASHRSSPLLTSTNHGRNSHK